MKWIGKIMGRLSSESVRDDGDTRAQPIRTNPVVRQQFMGGSDMTVSQHTALNISAVWCAVNVYSGTTASLPLNLYAKRPEGRVRVDDHPKAKLIRTAWTPEICAFNARETLMVSLLLWGNAYCQKVFNNAGKLVELVPIPPERVRMRRDRETGGLFYDVFSDYGSMTFERGSICHVPGMGGNGISGESVVSRAARSLGFSLSMEKFGVNFFDKGTNPAMVVSHPAMLGDDAHRHLSETLAEQYSGLGNAHRLMILEEGMKPEKMGFSLEDSQFLASRKFSVVEIARWFNLPPHKLKDLEKPNRATIEQENMSFYRDSLLPWLIRIEQNMTMQVLTPSERKQGFYFEHDVRGLMRADMQTRYNGYATARQWGWMSVNEIRKLENMPDVEGGNEYMVPMNMIPAGQREERFNPIGVETATTPQPEKRSAGYGDETYLESLNSPALRLVRKEAGSVRKAMRRIFRSDQTERFEDWLDKYYSEEFPATAVEIMGDALREYMTEMGMRAFSETGQSGSMADFESFVDEYISVYAERHGRSSSGQLYDLLITAIIDGENPEELVEERLSEWEERRPEKTAFNEITRAACAISSAIWFSGGYRLIWKTKGKSCPFCKMIDGKTISSGETFVSVGQEIDSSSGTMRVRRKKKHPPLHQRCDCGIEPAR